MTDAAPLVLYDSLTRSARPFAPIEPGHARVYSCGPTVYNYAHLGNLRAYVFTDTLSRVLTWKGYGLTHVINITDVGHLTSDADAGDDKMEAAARAQAKSIWDIAAHYTEAFKQNLADLKIRTPSRWSVATDHIAEMIDFAKAIEANCYELECGLYFDVTTVPDYGRLARTVDDAGESRIDPVAGKRHAQDFAIWRKSTPGENRQMEWDSPWGRGAPGWHLECSVMSHKYLGEQFDIHTGGIDHREIHHPNEIAQNQAHSCKDDHRSINGALNSTGANWWMHNNFLVDRGDKMSKSAGGFLTLQTIIDRGIHPLAYRLMCLQAHYRSELEFTWENLVAAQVRLKRLVGTVERLRAKDPKFAQWFVEKFSDSKNTFEASQSCGDSIVALRCEQVSNQMDADLSTPAALSVFSANLSDDSLTEAQRLEIVLRCDAVLGLNLAHISRSDLRVPPRDASLSEKDVEAHIAERKAARAAKDFATSDRIRDELAAAGVEIMDGDPLGWDWKVDLT